MWILLAIAAAAIFAAFLIVLISAPVDAVLRQRFWKGGGTGFVKREQPHADQVAEVPNRLHDNQITRDAQPETPNQSKHPQEFEPDTLRDKPSAKRE